VALKHVCYKIVKLFAVFMALYHLYSAAIGGTDPLFYRFTHVSMALVLGFMLLAIKKEGLSLVVDGMLAGAVILVYLYFNYNFERLVTHIPFLDMPTRGDLIAGVILIILVLEGTRRYIGWLLSLIALLFLLYAVGGPFLPGLLFHGGLSFSNVIDYMVFTLNGIMGSAVAVSSRYLILFIIFGSFLRITGVGEYFTELATALAGGTRGGPAKVAVITSAFIGSIIGCATANVTTTGVFTIPLMKRVGFKPDFAAGVEAAASTGGAMLPPIMGSSAFLMAEFLGIPYLEVAKASLLPALLYFLAVLIMVDIEAVKGGLRGLAKGEIPKLKDTAKRSYNLLPLLVITAALGRGYSPSFAALAGIAVCIMLGLFAGENRLSLERILEALEKSSVTVVQIIMACAVSGVIIGTVSLTGLSGKLTSILIRSSGGIELFILFFIMLSAIILGMGMVISPAYIMAAVLGAPVLIGLGFKPIAAHLFILYFAALAPLTPPVAIAAYAAAGIAGADMAKTAIRAVGLASAGFLIPYVFIYNNELLLMGSAVKVSLAIVTAIIGIACFGIGIQGFYLRSLSLPKRMAAIIGGLIMVIPGWGTDVMGLMVLLALVFLSRKSFMGWWKVQSN
jgi:TRAP transporter 4TM/12TM fusion protein